MFTFSSPIESRKQKVVDDNSSTKEPDAVGQLNSNCSEDADNLDNEVIIQIEMKPEPMDKNTGNNEPEYEEIANVYGDNEEHLIDMKSDVTGDPCMTQVVTPVVTPAKTPGDQGQTPGDQGQTPDKTPRDQGQTPGDEGHTPGETTGDQGQDSTQPCEYIQLSDQQH